MAQWRGQFTGLTHGSKVRDVEATLRTAIESLRSETTAAKRAKKAKAVRKLAERLLTVRLKLLKAQFSRVHPIAYDQEWNRERFEQEEAAMHTNGVNGVLAEFGALEATES